MIGEHQTPAAAPELDAEHAARKQLFNVGVHGAAAHQEPRTIPWSYGEDRVTAMAIDPERLYIYWEVTQEAIAKARAGLGQGGPTAWLNLRVYDTTHRLFDGTNAHSYFDQRVEREDRQRFFEIGKAASETVIEVGLLSNEGFFVKVARSGKVTFPRREPVAWAAPEWLTVRVTTGETVAAGVGLPGRPAGTWGGGAPPIDEPPPTERFEPVPLWTLHAPPWERYAWEEVLLGEHVHLWEELLEHGGVEGPYTVTWDGPAMTTSWETGPLAYPVEVSMLTSEAYTGPVRRFQVGGRTHVVYGPWQIVVRGLGAHASRRVLTRWEVHRSWVVSETHVEQVDPDRPAAAPVPPGASEHLLRGASELRWSAASELRLGGATELFFGGASERRLMGASETVHLAASETRLRGASERLAKGASEWLVKGASERLVRGASERLLGASERRLGGASERVGGGSEHRIGASENRLGPSKS